MKQYVQLRISAEHNRKLTAVAGVLDMSKQAAAEFLIDTAIRQIFRDYNPIGRADNLCLKGTLLADLPKATTPDTQP